MPAPELQSDTLFVSVIITTYHDAPAIPDLAKEIEQAFSRTNISWEAIWINDGSPDETRSCLDALKPPHRAIHFIHNQGQSAGYRAGAEVARGMWIATLDGDGQNDPADIPRLLAHAEHMEVDFVNGIRSPRRDPWLRCWSARIAGIVRNIATATHVSDAGCASRVIKRDVFLQIPFFEGNYYFFVPFAMRAGAKYSELPVNHRPRKHGIPNYGISNRIVPGLCNLLKACWLLRRRSLVRFIPKAQQCPKEM